MFKMMTLAAAVLALFAATPALAAPAIGQPAPDFTATDINGAEVKLSDLKGKNVVLEWTNPQCPFVVKQYDNKQMQTAQEQAVADGAVWISINSSAAGKEGSLSVEETKKIDAETGAKYSHKIIDADGTIGRLYDAKTTPHVFVIDATGNLVYMGAIDDDSSPRMSAKPTKNYVTAALADLKAGKPVETATTQPYGCGVKY